MTADERIEELKYALASIYRVRIDTRYDDLGRSGVSEVVLAEVLVNRAIKRAKGQEVGPLPKMLRDMRHELEAAS